MNDAAFLAGLEACTLPDTEFGHTGHVRAGYLYLKSMDYAAALVKIRSVIRNYAAALGKPERYHETITVAYLSLILRTHDRAWRQRRLVGFRGEQPRAVRNGGPVAFLPGVAAALGPCQKNILATARSSRIRESARRVMAEFKFF